jgi:hypothetical protein
MLNQPGVQTFFSGNEERARSYLPQAFALLTEYRRASANRIIEIDRFERYFGDVRIEVKVHHNQASLFIHAAVDQQPQIVQPLPRRRIRFVPDEELKLYDLIRLYVHVDLITETSYSSFLDKIERSDITSIVAACYYDPETGLVADIRTATIPYLIIFDPALPATDPTWNQPDWAALLSDVTQSLDETLAWYEQQLPGQYGSGTLAVSIEDADHWILGYPCSDAGYQHPFIDGVEEGYLYPWQVTNINFLAAPGASVQYTIPGCCTNAIDGYFYHQLAANSDYEYFRSDDYKKIKVVANEYRCDKVQGSLEHGLDPAGPAWWVNAYGSGIYGMIYNGYTRDLAADGSGLRTCGCNRSKAIQYADWILANKGPIIQATMFADEQGYPNEWGFDSSWLLPSGLGFYGEAFQFNLITRSSAGAATINAGVVNLNATLGYGLDPWAMTGIDETLWTTAAFKALLEAALVAGGATLVDPTTLSDKLSQSGLSGYGISAVDIRSLPGTTACDRALFNMKCYAAPITIRDQRSTTTIEEY